MYLIPFSMFQDSEGMRPKSLWVFSPEKLRLGDSGHEGMCFKTNR